jgi:hypothetical protein
MQNQTGVVICGQFCRKPHHHMVKPLRADRAGAQDGALGTVVKSAFDYFGADDIYRHVGSTEHGLGYRTHQHLSDGAGSVSTHDDKIDLSPMQEADNLVGRQSGPDCDRTGDAAIPCALGERLKTLLLGAGTGVGAAPGRRRLGCCHVQTIICMKK